MKQFFLKFFSSKIAFIDKVGLEFANSKKT